MEYKLIALDLDGTLTNSQKVITPETQKMLMHFQENGGKIVLASGRPTMGIIPHAETLRLKEYGGYILAFNGGCAVDCRTGETLFRETLPLSLLPEIYHIISSYPVGINTYEGDTLIVGNCCNEYTELEARINGMKLRLVEDFVQYVSFDIDKCLLHGDPELILTLEQELSQRFGDQLGIFKSEAFFLEIVPKGIDKAASLDRLLRHIGIPTEESIACGDGFNDISMIRYAGLGVAMSNAKQPVKEAADYITLSNDEDGIAYLLKKLRSGRSSLLHSKNSARRRA